MPGKANETDGRKLRWNQHKEERQRKIVDAALAVVSAHPPGAEVHVREIAERAGLSRTVIYRHFEDRADLDRAVRLRIVDDLWERMAPEVTLDGTVRDIIERIVSTYVTWAVDNPALLRLAEQGGNAETDPMQQGIERIAGKIAEILEAAITILELEPDDDMREALVPLVFGLVGAVLGAVRRWLAQPVRRPDAPALVSIASESVWFILHGHAASLGFELDPELTLNQMILDALDLG